MTNPGEGPRQEHVSRRNMIGLSLLGVGAASLGGCSDHGILPEQAADKAQVDDFVALSEELTGVKPLDRDLGCEYLERFASNPVVGPFLQDLLESYRAILLLAPADRPAALGSRILAAGAALRPAAEQLVYLWYTSAFAFRDQANPNKVVWQYGNEDQYNKALIWKVIRSHPPMTMPSQWESEPKV